MCISICAYVYIYVYISVHLCILKHGMIVSLSNIVLLVLEDVQPVPDMPIILLLSTTVDISSFARNNFRKKYSNFKVLQIVFHYLVNDAKCSLLMYLLFYHLTKESQQKVNFGKTSFFIKKNILLSFLKISSTFI